MSREKEENMEYPILPKPLVYVEHEDGTREATFDKQELKSFIDGISATSAVIRNDAGEIIGITRIRPLREMLSV